MPLAELVLFLIGELRGAVLAAAAQPWTGLQVRFSRHTSGPPCVVSSSSSSKLSANVCRHVALLKTPASVVVLHSQRSICVVAAAAQLAGSVMHMHIRRQVVRQGCQHRTTLQARSWAEHSAIDKVATPRCLVSLPMPDGYAAAAGAAGCRHAFAHGAAATCRHQHSLPIQGFLHLAAENHPAAGGQPRARHQR